MKKGFLYFTSLFIVLFAFASCNDDDVYYNSITSGSTYWESYGVIHSITEDGNTVIKRDSDGAKLIISRNLVPSFENKIGQRLVATYSIISELENDNIFENIFDKSYYIELIYVEKVLTKGVVEQSYINTNVEHIEDSLGNEPIMEITKAWITDKFLNINFHFIHNRKLNTKNMISLIFDDVTPGADGAVVLTLRQNIEVDTQIYLYRAFSRVAFDISSIIPEGQTSVKIILNWDIYAANSLEDVVTKSSSTIFYQPTNSASKSGKSEGSNILIDGSDGFNEITTKVE